jgi:hypothetical protein
MSTTFNTGMTREMVDDFKKWSRTLGGEDVMDGVQPDIRKYINLGFCRDDFIKDMEYSWVNDVMFYDPIVEDPEYEYEEWEHAKAREMKTWMIQAKAFLNLCKQNGVIFKNTNL